MSSTDGEIGMRNLTDKATYERLEKDVAAVKDDIAALADQITDVLNSFAGTAKKQAHRGYKQARANVDATVDDLSDRGSAMMDAAHDAAHSLEAALLKLCADGALRVRLGAAARETIVRKSLTWMGSAERVVAVAQAILQHEAGAVRIRENT